MDDLKPGEIKVSLNAPVRRYWKLEAKEGYIVEAHHSFNGSIALLMYFPERGETPDTASAVFIPHDALNDFIEQTKAFARPKGEALVYPSVTGKEIAKIEARIDELARIIETENISPSKRWIYQAEQHIELEKRAMLLELHPQFDSGKAYPAPNHLTIMQGLVRKLNNIDDEIKRAENAKAASPKELRRREKHVLSLREARVKLATEISKREEAYVPPATE